MNTVVHAGNFQVMSNVFLVAGTVSEPSYFCSLLFFRLLSMIPVCYQQFYAYFDVDSLNTLDILFWYVANTVEVLFWYVAIESNQCKKKILNWGSKELPKNFK